MWSYAILLLVAISVSCAIPVQNAVIPSSLALTEHEISTRELKFVWLGHGAKFGVTDSGHIPLSSRDPNKLGAPVPSVDIDMSHSMKENTCVDITVFDDVNAKVCGVENGCKTLETAHSKAKACADHAGTIQKPGTSTGGDHRPNHNLSPEEIKELLSRIIG